MKVVILAGGLGSRLSEETKLRPKPLVEIGDIPIIEHVMNWYLHFGLTDFYLCIGYLGEQIIDYFKDYHLRGSTVRILPDGSVKTLECRKKPWTVTLVQSGLKSQTGGRIKKIKPFLYKDENFLMTYADGLSNIDINLLQSFHKSHGKLATVSAVRPTARFGALKLEENNVKEFREKPVTEGGWINGGYFVLSEKVLDYISDDSSVWEQGPMKSLVEDEQLEAFKHYGFWQPMDTLREKNILNTLWDSGSAPWIPPKEDVIPIHVAR